MIKSSANNVAKSKKEIAKGHEKSVSNVGHFGIIVDFLMRAVQLISLAHIALSLIAIIIALVIIEILIRVAEEERYDFSACQSLDRNFHHVMIPNTTCRFKAEEWDTTYKINGLGLRDEEISPQKNRFRILLLGDSFAQGYGVAQEETFGEVLESQGANLEVINSGVFGYSPLIEYLYLKKRGLAFKPDLVILEFSLTDFFEDRLRFGELKLSYPDKSDEEIKKLIREGNIEFDWNRISSQGRAVNVTKLQELVFKIKQSLKKNFRIYKIVADLWEKRDEVQQDVIYQGNIDRDILALVRGDKINDKNWEKLWELPIEHVQLVKKELDRAGIPLVVVAIPDAFEVSIREWPGRKSLEIPSDFLDPRGDWQDELSKRLTEFNIPLVNLISDFRQSNTYPLYFDSDGHFRQSGHRLAASVILRELVKYFDLQ